MDLSNGSESAFLNQIVPRFAQLSVCKANEGAAQLSGISHPLDVTTGYLGKYDSTNI